MRTLGGTTMGTGWSVRYVAERHAPEPPALAGAIEARLGALVDALSHWAPGSALCRYNRAAAGTWQVLPADLAAVIGSALALHDLSGGAFDPAIGRLVDLWGFGPPGARPAPTDADVAAARAAGGAARMRYDPGSSRLFQPGGVALDLSGIAKGYAVDAIGRLLVRHGVHHHLVEIGGELVGNGVTPEGEPWWVDLETPSGGDAAPLRLALHGIAVATTGDYVRGRHTIDPRNGRPATNGVRAVSVVADDAMQADGWATILAVLPPEESMSLAAAHGIAARLLIGQADGALAERLTPALAAMLED